MAARLTVTDAVPSAVEGLESARRLLCDVYTHVSDPGMQTCRHNTSLPHVTTRNTHNS